MAAGPKQSYAWSILVVFLIAGWFFPVIGIMALVCMIAPVMVALISGKRKWCALFCPRGIFSDVILARITRHGKTPAILTSNYFKIAFLIFLMANLFIGIIDARGNAAAIGMVFVRLVSLTTAIAIILGFVYSQRTWCGFCPMGFLATLAIKGRRFLKTTRRAPPVPAAEPNINIVLYTGNQCPACDRVKELLGRYKVQFNEVNIDLDKPALEEMADRHGSIAIPALAINGKLEKRITEEGVKRIFGPGANRMAG